MNKKTKNEKSLATVAGLAEDKRSRLERAILPKGCEKTSMVVLAEHSTPDWEFWQDMPDVELWQACALSLNLNPDSIAPHYDGMGAIRLADSHPRRTQ